MLRKMIRSRIAESYGVGCVPPESALSRAGERFTSVVLAVRGEPGFCAASEE